MTAVRLTNFEVAVIEAALQDYMAKHPREEQRQAFDTANTILKKLGSDLFR